MSTTPEEPELELKSTHTEVPPERQEGEGWLSAALRQDNSETQPE